MKIAQVAPLMESVPPRLYGGTERIVSYLTEELVEQGHDVTLFASGDSLTSAAWCPCTAEGAAAERRQGSDPLPSDHARRGAPACRRRSTCCTSTSTCCTIPVIRDFAWRTVTTLHGRLDLPDMHPLYSTFSDAPLVSISDNQRKPMPPVNWAGRIHHGLPQNLLQPLGARRRRLSRLPRPHLAREAARPRHRDRGAQRAASCASPPRSTRSTATTGARRSSRCCGAMPTSTTSARSATPRRRTSWATPRRCCFPSTGPSRSAWS